MMEASRITLEYMQKKEEGRYWTDRMRLPSVGIERTCREGRIGSVCHRDTRRRDVWLVVFLSATTPAAAAAASFPGGSSLAALSEMQVTVHLASYSIHQVRAVMDGRICHRVRCAVFATKRSVLCRSLLLRWMAIALVQTYVSAGAQASTRTI
jgi:hypothetical protein